MSSLAAKTAEPIAGYTVRERIGAGGYGEVWSAETPGGLEKAIKFVYGYLDDDRAARELKALNRIKEVRHPFLLSLERIEVVDGQLIIVTELADMSLKDRYDEYRDEGQQGIPRGDLLVYLSDAADALDFMRENHSLQHLDVKPENLLMVGGRAKVADFGLVKDIHETTASMMGGLTPTYAPPEAFDGRPSLRSDQYSLAIVYQEMLTGCLPFPGTTTTQLAIQHLDSRPRLGSLPEHDQPAIGRALAKQPDDRFGSCRELIDSLIEAGQAKQGRRDEPAELDGIELTGDTTPVSQHATEAARKPKSGDRAGGTEAHTMSFDSDHVPPSRRAVTQDMETDWREAAHDVSVLPPLDVSSDEDYLRPTLILGIGGTAAAVLGRLRHRLNHRFKEVDAVPVIKTLLIDTDQKAISAATRGNESESLPYHQTLAIPLRKPEDYREDSEELLKWLSRRWLYNIPRSLETEGRRPLGRLAFVDHSQKVTHFIRSALETIMSKQALTTAKAETGLEFRSEVPRIVVVSSISGGTGGGMVLDLAYAIRALLADLGYSDKGLMGVLCHSTGSNPAERDLAVANAYACLAELQHYASTSQFPGDPACNLPPAGDIPTFHDTYLVHLGDELDGQQFKQSTDDLAHYLYLNTATSAGKLFDKCREREDRLSEPRSAGVKLRTFGLDQFGYSHGPIPTAAAEILSRELVLRWAGQPGKGNVAGNRRDNPAGAPAAEGLDGESFDELIERLELTPEQVRRHSAKAMEAELGIDPYTYFTSLVQQTVTSGEADFAKKVLFALDEQLGPRGDSNEAENGTSNRLPDPLVKLLRQLVAKQGEAIQASVLDLVDHPNARAAKAKSTVQELVEHVTSIRSEAARELDGIAQTVSSSLRTLCSNGGAGNAKPRGMFGFGRSSKRTPEEQQRWIDLCHNRVRELELRALVDFLGLLRARLATIGDRVTNIQQELRLLADEFDAEQAWEEITAEPSGEPTASDELCALLANVVKLLVPKLTRQLEAEFEEGYISDHGGLHAVLEHKSGLDRPISVTLRRASRRVLLESLAVVDVAEPLLGARGSSPESRRLHDCLTNAAPRLSECGGGKRVLLVMPDGSDAETIRSELESGFGETSSVVFDHDGDIVLCQEVERISLAHAAAALSDYRPDYADAASRLHTRVDVSWTPLGKRG